MPRSSAGVNAAGIVSPAVGVLRTAGVMDSSQLLHTLKIEAEQLESAIRITYNKSFEASHPDRIYKLMHEEYTRLCKLRKMKEFQICMLLGNIFNQPQQQASL